MYVISINRSFSDACNTIKAAITGKGVTPSSSKPADLADAINKISTTTSTYMQSQTVTATVTNGQLFNKTLTFTFKNKVLGIASINFNVYGATDTMAPYYIGISGNTVTIKLVCKATNGSREMGGTITVIGY